MKIHPTAIVHPKAQIGNDVEIGAYAFIGEHVKIGNGSVIHHHASVEGHTTMGEFNEVGSFSVIGSKPQDLKYKNEPTRLEIGDKNCFREYVTVNTGTPTGGNLTSIGSNSLLMAYCHVAHDCHLGNNVIMANHSNLAGHVTLEDWVILSGMCGVSQFLRVGKHAFIGGMSGVDKDVAPYVIAVGNRMHVRGVNLVGLKRRGFDSERVKAVLDTYKIYFESGKEKEHALAEIQEKFPYQEDVKYFVDFVKNSKHGIAR